MGLKKFVKSLWERLDEFDRYILKVVLIFMIIFFFLGLIFPTILDSPLKWISKAFSVPIRKDKLFSIDASDIITLFIIFIIFLSWPINKLIKSKFKRKK